MLPCLLLISSPFAMFLCFLCSSEIWWSWECCQRWKIDCVSLEDWGPEEFITESEFDWSRIFLSSTTGKKNRSEKFALSQAVPGLGRFVRETILQWFDAGFFASGNTTLFWNMIIVKLTVLPRGLWGLCSQGGLWSQGVRKITGPQFIWYCVDPLFWNTEI